MDPVPARFNCIICSNILKRPLLTECCGQHFCQSCLTEWVRPKRPCPQCRAQQMKYMLNKSLEREIDELEVYCTYRGKGCKWVGEKAALANHLGSASGCQYQPVKCPLGNCGKKMTRVVYFAHVKNECLYRQCMCEYCGHKDTFKALTGGGGSPNHYDQCPQYPLACPNKCGATNILRKDMDSHRKACPLEKVSCPYVETGCGEGSMLRKDLAAHVEKDMQQHMLGLLKSHMELKEKYEKLEKSKNRYYH